MGNTHERPLNALAKEIHEDAVEHGWWDDERSFGEVIALCHSELSEALEEYRANRPNLWYGPADENGNVKPEGIAIEMIDCLIRILDWCGKEKLNVDSLVAIKMAYNKTRPYKHGGKRI